MRFLRSAVFCLSMLVAALAAPLAVAQTNYTTNIVVSHLLTSQGLTSVAAAPYATVCLSPADVYGNPIAVSASTWGVITKNTQFCGSVVAGAISGGINVPDAAHTFAATPIYYNITIQITTSTGAPLGQATVLQAVPNITGTTYDLDDYAPNVASAIAPSGTLGENSSVPGVCTSPSLFIRSSDASLWVCASGTYVQVSGSGGGASTPATADLLKGNGSPNGVVAAAPGTDYVIPSGNVATATALAATPTPCSTGQAPTGILANGNSTGCAPIGSGGGGPSAVTSTFNAGTSQYGWHFHGDSLTAGAGDSSPATLNLPYCTPTNSCSGYPVYVVNDIVWGGITTANILNDAVPFDTSMDITLKVFTHENPQPFNNPIQSTFDGMNNAAANCITTACANEFFGNELANDTYLALSSTQKLQASVSTTTGTWTADTTFPYIAGKQSTVNGSTISWALSVPTAGILYVHYRDFQTSGGTFTCSLNGGSALTDTVTGSTTISSQGTGYPTTNGGTNGVKAARFVVTPGNYTSPGLACTVTSATGSGNNVNILEVAYPPEARTRGKGAPRVLVIGVTPEQNNTNGTNTLFYYNLSQTVSTQAFNDGLNVQFVASRQYIDVNTDFAANGNCVASTNLPVHFSHCGHINIAAALEDAANVGTDSLASPLTNRPLLATVTSAAADVATGFDQFAPHSLSDTLLRGSQICDSSTICGIKESNYSSGPLVGGYSLSIYSRQNYIAFAHTSAINPTSESQFSTLSYIDLTGAYQGGVPGAFHAPGFYSTSSDGSTVGCSLVNATLSSGCTGPWLKTVNVIHTGATATIANAIAAPATGTYLLNYTVSCTAASSGTITLTGFYTDTSFTQQNLTGSNVVNCATLGASSVATITQTARQQGGQQIGYSAVVTGTVNYDFTMSATPLTPN